MKRNRRTRRRSYRFLAAVLCLSMVGSILAGTNLTSVTANAAPDEASSTSGEEPTDSKILVENSRIADPDTTDTYQDALLNDENGSRYAGRVWTDKSVFAYGENNGSFDSKNNQINLDMKTDGYDGTVGVNSDFLHVYSALTSSQIVNEYPPTPIDLVITFDMSGSMGQDTRYEIDHGVNHYTPHLNIIPNLLTKYSDGYPVEGVPMADRIANSRIQKTLDAINETIDSLMEQNPQNRVAVCAYGANATVLMPLAHWKGNDKNEDGVTDYLSVGGMETLYHPSDLQARGGTWYWMNNRDTCYTVVADAKYNTTTTAEFNNQLNEGPNPPAMLGRME